jgi:hypothetical protein
MLSALYRAADKNCQALLKHYQKDPNKYFLNT